MRLTTIVSLSITLTAAIALPAMSAQNLRAIAEDGRKVILSPNGKWKFDNTPQTALSTSDSASSYQTTVSRFSLNFDTSKWTLMPKQEEDPYTKRVFHHKSLPIVGIVAADQIPASKEALRNIILSNANSTATAMTILEERDLQAGDKTVGSIKFAATAKALDLVFLSIYHGDEDGNIQVSCISGQSVFHKYERDCQLFVSGIIIK
jgi:hypothetical protein